MCVVYGCFIFGLVISKCLNFFHISLVIFVLSKFNIPSILFFTILPFHPIVLLIWGILLSFEYIESVKKKSSNRKQNIEKNPSTPPLDKKKSAFIAIMYNLLHHSSSWFIAWFITLLYNLMHYCMFFIVSNNRLSNRTR